MTKFEVIKAITDEQKFSELVFDLIVKYDSPDAFAKLLSEEFSENEPGADVQSPWLSDCTLW